MSNLFVRNDLNISKVTKFIRSIILPSIRPTFYPVHGLSPSLPYFSWTQSIESRSQIIIFYPTFPESRSQIVLFETYFSSCDTCDYYLKPTFHVRCTDLLRMIDDINSLNYILKSASVLDREKIKSQ